MDHQAGGSRKDAPRDSTRALAASATLHCLTGCAIGEVAGLIVGTALGLSNAVTIGVSISLAFVFGYALSSLPLLKAGLATTTALGLVIAADTPSILTMEIVDNWVMTAIPGAMNAGLVNIVFWVGMMISFVAAFLTAYPVNLYLLRRGRGHALTHATHGVSSAATSPRRIPAPGTGALTTGLIAFLVCGLIVSTYAELGPDRDETPTLSIDE
jgi:hypothetical protein